MEKLKRLSLKSKPKTLVQSPKQKEKATIEDVWKKVLETLVASKNWKQEEGEELKRKKKSETAGSATLAYLREKAAKDQE